MSRVREEILKRLENKRSEISALEMQIREAKTYIVAFEEMLALLSGEIVSPDQEGIVTDRQRPASSQGQGLRPGSVVANARQAILAAGHDLHINDILKALNKPSDNATRAAVSGSMSAYVREGKIFTRPAPNTFGLIELTRKRGKSVGPVKPSDGPPPNFGLTPDEEEKDFEIPDVQTV